jgi:hypothetical protein
LWPAFGNCFRSCRNFPAGNRRFVFSCIGGNCRPTRTCVSNSGCAEWGGSFFTWDFSKEEVHMTREEERRFRCVRPNPNGGWDALIHVPGGFTERLRAKPWHPDEKVGGVFGFAVDAAIARNIWIAYWNMGGAENYNRTRNKPNVIPAEEMFHD